MTRNWTNKNSYGCEHVRPRDDWGESVEQWLSSMLAIGRTPETLRTRWDQIARFSRIVDRPIDQVDADAVIAFFLQSSMDLEAKRNARACVKGFYQWAVAHRIADHNPIDEVPVIPTRPRACFASIFLKQFLHYFSAVWAAGFQQELHHMTAQTRTGTGPPCLYIPET